MPEIRIPYLLREDGSPVVLLTAIERSRLGARIEDLERRADLLGEADRLGDEAALMCQIDALEQEAETNDGLLARPEVKTAVVEYETATRDHQKAVRKVIAEGGDGAASAVDLLRPRITEEWEGDIPLAFWPAIEAECLAAIFPVMSEDRRFFSPGSPSA